MKTDEELKELIEEQLRAEHFKIKKELEAEERKTVNIKKLPEEGKYPDDWDMKNYKIIKNLEEYIARIEKEMARREISN